MTKREQLIEQYEDAVFALAMDKIAASEGEKYLKLNRQLKDDPTAEVPESVRRRAERTIVKTFRKSRAMSVARIFSNVVNKVAMLFLVISTIFATAFTASPDFRAATYSFVMKVFDDHFVYSFLDKPERIESEQFTHFELGWMPEGYDLFYQSSDNISYQVVYKDEQGNIISAWLMSLSSFGQVSADADNAILSQDSVNGYDVTIFYNDCIQAVIQIPASHQVIHLFASSSEFPRETLNKIIENLKFL